MADPMLLTHSPIPFASGVLDRYHHVCAFVESTNELHRLTDAFVKAGIAGGEKALHVVDPTGEAAYTGHLQAIGLDIPDLSARGQFDLRTWHGAYLSGGYFEPDKMLDLLLGALKSGRQEQGYPRTRFVANLGWAAQNYPGVEKVLEYESRGNYAIEGYPDPVICVWNTTQFGADFLFDVLRTHPMAVIRGVLHENPFFVPQDEFLAELKERHHRSGGT
jgi:hypothetical protein